MSLVSFVSHFFLRQKYTSSTPSKSKSWGGSGKIEFVGFYTAFDVLGLGNRTVRSAFLLASLSIAINCVLHCPLLKQAGCPFINPSSSWLRPQSSFFSSFVCVISPGVQLTVWRQLWPAIPILSFFHA